ncbi:hypothetical protein BV898_02561 [Hypsibius exemplaris]|uniref:Mimitin, mitochondrial n=1 Tax=Hypsibius exemplaris TaxID=2072580 RepID=A0A1W0X7C4_HYPEX|nr:hypothetical protein BV898_02561 [Hypsibius exemplaris]
MAGRMRPGGLKYVWMNFVNSLKLRRDTRVLMGDDYLGNKYFEQKTNSKEEDRTRTMRSYEPRNEETWEQVPPEWEAWLRNKRPDAPTREEIAGNLELMKQKQDNAKKLEAKRLTEIAAGETYGQLQPEDPTAAVPFPKYDDIYDKPTMKGAWPWNNDHVSRLSSEISCFHTDSRGNLQGLLRHIWMKSVQLSERIFAGGSGGGGGDSLLRGMASSSTVMNGMLGGAEGSLLRSAVSAVDGQSKQQQSNGSVGNKQRADGSKVGDTTVGAGVNRSTAVLNRIEGQTEPPSSSKFHRMPESAANGSVSFINNGGPLSYPEVSPHAGPESRVHGRIAALLHERDSYQELLRDAVARVFQLEQRLKLEEEHPEVELLQQKAMEMYRRSKATISALNGDVTELRQQFQAERTSKDAQRLQLVTCQKELEMAKTTLKMQENGLEMAQDTIKRLSTESFGLQQSLAAAQATVATMKQDRNGRMRDDQASVERNLILAQKYDESEKRTSDTMTKLEEAVEFGEKAIRARDHLANRLREMTAEMSELRDQEAKTYAEMSERSRREIQQLKQTSEDAINQLREEVRQLETKLTDKDIELGRTQREVRTLQMQAERAEREALAGHHDLSTPDDLFRRLSAAEQDRDRLTLLVQSTQTSLRQKIDQMSQREAKFEKSMKDQNERLKETINQCEKLNNEHVAMAEEIQRLEGQLSLKEKSLQILNRDIQSEIYTMKEKGRLAEADRTAKDAAMEESHQQSLLDMQQVNKLLRQQVAHWQAEFNNLQNNHELRVRQMKS